MLADDDNNTMTRLLERPYLMTPDTQEPVYLQSNVELRCAAINPNTGELRVLRRHINHHSRVQTVTFEAVKPGEDPITVPTFLIIHTEEAA